MRWVVTIPGKLAACAFIGASGAMNWMFMESQGHSASEGRILGMVSLAITVFNAILPFAIRRAVDRRNLVSAAVGGVALALFLSFSLLSAIGFAAMNRGAISGDRETLNARLGLAEAELKELEAEQAGRKMPLRAAAEIEQELAALRVNARWTSSKECTAPTVPESRALCEGYFRVKGELGAALANTRRDQRRTELRKEMRELRARGAGQEVDPRTSLLTKVAQRWVPEIELSDVRTMLTLFVAVLVEFGAAFGLYLAGSAEEERGRALRRTPKARVAEPLRVHDLPLRVNTMERVPMLSKAQGRLRREPERFEVEHARSLLSSIAGRA